MRNSRFTEEQNETPLLKHADNEDAARTAGVSAMPGNSAARERSKLDGFRRDRQ